ncbi:putative virulence factor, partial [Rhodovulum sulfidophilum]|nr:putative virulence factor [Rhodovulum sulfidophilum]
MTTKDQLAERCARVETAARKALDWVSDPENAETVGLDRKSLAQALRKGARRAQKLGRAARTKMSVSVFGPSQAGKSFLISVLARPEDGRLVADFQGPGGQLDYIREINPEGEGESTGLVTRFTMTKAPCPEGFPI